MNFFGIFICLLTLFVIGMGFVWVIRGERYFGYLWWPYTLGLGILCVLISLFVTSDFICALIGSAGASLIWGSTELKEQAVRGELSWFPYNGKKIDPPFVDVIKKWKAPSL